MPTPVFTPADVQALVAHAESAPLANMRHAEAISKLTRRFVEWYNYVQEQGQEQAQKFPDAEVYE